MTDLTRKLHANAAIPSRGQQTYQQFFSEFVGHNQRGHFFAGLGQRLPFSAVRIDADLWEHRYQQAQNKILE